MPHKNYAFRIEIKIVVLFHFTNLQNMNVNSNSHPLCLQSVLENHYYQTKIKIEPRIINHLAKWMSGFEFALCILGIHNLEAVNKKQVKMGTGIQNISFHKRKREKSFP